MYLPIGCSFTSQCRLPFCMLVIESVIISGGMAERGRRRWRARGDGSGFGSLFPDVEYAMP